MVYPSNWAYPYTCFGSLHLVDYVLVVFQVVFVNDVVELWISNVKRPACESDNRCDGWVGDAARKHTIADIACRACEDDPHVVYWLK